MVTTLSGIVMEGRAEQFRKAPLPIDTTPLPIETEESSTYGGKKEKYRTNFITD